MCIVVSVYILVYYLKCVYALYKIIFLIYTRIHLLVNFNCSKVGQKFTYLIYITSYIYIYINSK